MQTPEASAAKDRAWTYLFSSFRTRVYPSSFRKFMLMKKNNFSAEVFFKEGPGSLQSVFGSERRYWNEQMKNALGLALFPFNCHRDKIKPFVNKVVNPCCGFHGLDSEPQGYIQWSDEDLYNPGLFLWDKIQWHFPRNETETHLCGWIEKVVVRSQHATLVSAIEFPRFLRHPGMWNLGRYFTAGYRYHHR